MITPLSELPAVDPDSGHLNVVIDTPKGCRNKYKFDEEHGQWRLSKVLPLGLFFPCNFGFLPSTQGEDGDPVDVLVLMEWPSFPGCLVPVRLIGALEAEQTQQGQTMRNDRLIGVAERSRLYKDVRELSGLPGKRVEELEHFFISYNAERGRQFRILKRSSRRRATTLLEAGERRFREKK